MLKVRLSNFRYALHDSCSSSNGIAWTYARRRDWLVFVPLIFIFIIMYFVMIRPQKKRQEQQQKLVGSLKTGDRVVTNAGIHGLISNVKETTVLVKVADNVKIEIDKSAITNVLKEA